ncbi:hypothetical protein Cyrtocomes_01046 [Candidatus Cyrtobacter comes]|uniref:Uncharacterized protein n=1 Tax=Candidatus Cyrtobacter comes TaxID=675776 RepID=A0ABU5L9U0_9RICK|nr:hypothetical protein [Candidatus Cyrtobacter comes]
MQRGKHDRDEFLCKDRSTFAKFFGIQYIYKMVQVLCAPEAIDGRFRVAAILHGYWKNVEGEGFLSNYPLITTILNMFIKCRDVLFGSIVIKSPNYGINVDLDNLGIIQPNPGIEPPDNSADTFSSLEDTDVHGGHTFIGPGWLFFSLDVDQEDRSPLLPPKVPIEW